ncbi:unnamed protein product [Laminaria digitata]
MLSHAKAGLTSYPGVVARALRRKAAPCPTWRPAASTSSVCFRALSNTTRALSSAVPVGERCGTAAERQSSIQALSWQVRAQHGQGAGERDSLRWGVWGVAAATAALTAEGTADNQVP